MRTSRHIRLAGLLITFLTATLVVAAQDVTLPRKQSTLKFAVIGDTGTGDSNQYRVAKVLAAARQTFPFEFVVMVGDNMYGADNPRDYEKKFEIPYKPILDAGVKFYAALGNHDSPNQKQYKLFNMNGQRFYTFKPKDGVRFFALDSNYMDPEQLQWAEKELKASGSDWKIAFFHHPLYSSGERHGSDTAMKDQLEPLFQRYSVDVVLTGHDHVYERIKLPKDSTPVTDSCSWNSTATSSTSKSSRTQERRSIRAPLYETGSRTHRRTRRRTL